jgi:hypothetical protein
MMRRRLMRFTRCRPLFVVLVRERSEKAARYLATRQLIIRRIGRLEWQTVRYAANDLHDFRTRSPRASPDTSRSKYHAAVRIAALASSGPS